MDADAARALLHNADPDDGEVTLPPSLLPEITAADLPEGIEVQIGVLKRGVIHLEWNGSLRSEEGRITAVVDLTWTRKYWYEPLGLEQYLDLVRRAVEVRQRIRTDVEVDHYEDDGAYVQFSYLIYTGETNLARALTAAKRVSAELEEAAHHAVDDIGKTIAEVAARVSDWGNHPLEVLVEDVARASDTDAKGRSLEELCSRLFETVKGFSITGRIRTATEEIDISILNDSDDPRLRRESAIILAECKNWSGKCDKDAFVVFREKMENRNRRCSLGFLISWNGFASTVTKEMLRGSREGELIIPISGEELRAAVRDRNSQGSRWMLGQGGPSVKIPSTRREPRHEGQPFVRVRGDFGLLPDPYVRLKSASLQNKSAF